MTIDEAIEHAIEKADKNEHEQLAEWLEELKDYKENQYRSLRHMYEKGYNKALDDIVTIIKEFVGMDWEWDFCFIEQIAEQLKAGGMNEYNI